MCIKKVKTQRKTLNVWARPLLAGVNNICRSEHLCSSTVLHFNAVWWSLVFCTEPHPSHIVAPKLKADSAVSMWGDCRLTGWTGSTQTLSPRLHHASVSWPAGLHADIYVRNFLLHTHIKKHVHTQKQALKRLLIKAEIWVQLLKPQRCKLQASFILSRLNKVSSRTEAAGRWS